ncbi:Remorin [Vitis vinifera]|uniref:Remorin n=1 Tax=Vitis vinifera TaxID=29760 RepID=A0A438CWU5_VITVI|nr:Remorin [Vitis vinifera]RVW74461.1 Remorin [Vitis vinifera]
MSAEEPKTVAESETPTDPPPPEPTEAPKDVTEEKAVIPPAPPPEEKPDETKALAIVEKVPEPIEEKGSEGGSVNRDTVLARVATEKRLSLIRAWEESEKCKAENKAQKKLSATEAWENSQKASVEAELKKIENLILVFIMNQGSSSRAISSKLHCVKMINEWHLDLSSKENLERKKAEYVEKMKNKIAIIHKEAEEKRAMIEARRGEDLLKAEEMAAKYRATGSAPKKLLGCF